MYIISLRFNMCTPGTDRVVDIMWIKYADTTFFQCQKDSCSTTALNGLGHTGHRHGRVSRRHWQYFPGVTQRKWFVSSSIWTWPIKAAGIVLVNRLVTNFVVSSGVCDRRRNVFPDLSDCWLASRSSLTPHAAHQKHHKGHRSSIQKKLPISLDFPIAV